jgi:hypothetical protein
LWFEASPNKKVSKLPISTKQASNPSYTRGRGRRIGVVGQPQTKPYLKRAGGGATLVEGFFPSMFEALVQSPLLEIKKKREERGV